MYVDKKVGCMVVELGDILHVEKMSTHESFNRKTDIFKRKRPSSGGLPQFENVHGFHGRNVGEVMASPAAAAAYRVCDTGSMVLRITSVDTSPYQIFTVDVIEGGDNA